METDNPFQSWQSGRMRRIETPVRVNALRGFEPHTLRQASFRLVWRGLVRFWAHQKCSFVPEHSIPRITNIEKEHPHGMVELDF